MISIFYANPSDASPIAKLFVENVDESYITASEEIWNRATLENGWCNDLYDNVRLEILDGIKSGDKLILVMYDDEKLIGYTFTAFKNNSCAELEDFVEGYDDKTYEVYGDKKEPTLDKTLDDLFEEESEFDLIKIDVEGFEYNVLLGGEQYIKTSYPVLVVEQEDKNNPATELLRSWGYQVIDSVKHDYIYKKI